MFYVDKEKVMDRLLEEVFPNIQNLELEDLVKYCLAAKHLSTVSGTKKMMCITGFALGASGFFFLTSPIVVAACATGAIASIVKGIKSHKDTVLFEKIILALSIAMREYHAAGEKDVQAVLDNISAEEFKEFLENNNLVESEE